MWGLGGCLDDVQSHIFLRDGETEAPVSQNLPGTTVRMRVTSRPGLAPGPDPPGQGLLCRAPLPPWVSLRPPARPGNQLGALET